MQFYRKHRWHLAAIQMCPRKIDDFMFFMVFFSTWNVSIFRVFFCEMPKRAGGRRRPFYWKELSHFGNDHTAVQLLQNTRLSDQEMPDEPESEYSEVFFKFRQFLMLVFSTRMKRRETTLRRYDFCVKLFNFLLVLARV